MYIGVYISLLAQFVIAFSKVGDCYDRNKSLTSKLLKEGYHCHRLRKTFSKFYRRHSYSISKYNFSLKTPLQDGLSEPEFYDDFVYKFRKNNAGQTDFSE